MTTQNKNTAVSILLAKSLKELALSKPIEKITIKEITDRSDVIRPTFYNHFQDKYELLEWIINTDLLEPIRPLIKNGMVNEGMELLLTNIANEKEFYLHAVKMEGPITFGDIALKCSKAFLIEVLTEDGAEGSTKHRWLTKEVVATYYAQSMSFVIMEWLNTGMIFTPKEMANAYEYIMTRSMADVTKEMGGSLKI